MIISWSFRNDSIFDFQRSMLTEKNIQCNDAYKEYNMRRNLNTHKNCFRAIVFIKNIYLSNDK